MLAPLKVPAKGGRPAVVAQALNEWNDDLQPEDRRAKYLRMAASPFVFDCGSNHLFWADFAVDERLGRFGDPEDTRT